MNRHTAPLVIVIGAVLLGAATMLVAGMQRRSQIVLDGSMDDISSAFSETDQASQVLSKEGGLSLVGRDYEVLAAAPSARSMRTLPSLAA